jgi:hypothetical protein
MSIISYYMCRSLDIMLVKVAQTSVEDRPTVIRDEDGELQISEYQ